MEHLNIYNFRADGIALGSTIIVISNSLTNALNVAKTRVKTWKLDPDSVELETTEQFMIGVLKDRKSQIVHSWNGDY